MCQRCEGPSPVSEAAQRQYEIYKTLNWSLLYGRAGEGKNYAAASKVLEKAACVHRGEALQCRYVGGSYIVGYLRDEEAVKVPQKICGYRKPKVYWFGETGTNVPYSLGNRSAHFAVLERKLEDFFAEYVKESLEMANSFEADPLKGRRFIGINEPTDSEQIDNDSLKRLTGDEWTEARTLDVSSKAWVPQGKLFIGGSKPLKINEKSKEIIEQVKRIEYPVVPSSGRD